MKRFVLLFVGLAGALSLLWAGVLVAANVRTGDSPTVMSGETIDGTLYSAGNTIRVDGTVKGDLMCAGQQVEITGTVEGDVLCAAQDITISGHVEGSVRSAAQTMSITGKIDGSTTIAAMTASIGKSAIIGRDLTLAGQTLTMDGTIGRDGQVVGKTFTTNGTYGRELSVNASTITLNDKAVVSGDFNYRSAANATITSGAHIAGQTTHQQPAATPTPAAVSVSAYIAAVVLGFASFLLLGVAVLGASPRLLAATSHAIRHSPLGTIGVGLLGMIAPPFVTILLFISVIGIPLAFVILFSWFISMLLAVAITGHALGQVVITKLHWQEKWQNFAAIVLGLFILFLLMLIPYVGGFVLLVSLLWGLGGLWYAAVSQRHMAPMTQKVEKKKS